MIQAIKNTIKRTFIYGMIKRIRWLKEFRDWEKRGRPIPPPYLVKQRTVKQYAKKFSIDILIETGTYMGDMVDATKSTFSRIFSIELDKMLCEQAKKKFSRFDHITIIHGNSSKVLPDILANITHPCLFWLDAHYSDGITAKGKLETPIIEELHHVLHHPVAEHVILIDDARCFVGSKDYPTINWLKDLIFRHPNWVFEVKDDIIRIYKKYGT